jgi:hypothetical protein
MAIYRKIDCRISNDKKFRELSVEGKLAWYTILSRRDLAPIGAFKASFESLAIEQRGNEYLNKDLQKDLPKGFSEVFIKALNELLSKGLIKYDSEAFLIYVPNFLKYNFPENPNVVKSWKSALDSLPECNLTNYVLAKSTEIIISSQRDSYTKALPKEFVEAYRKGFGKDFYKGSIEPFRKGMPKQEQEQEQEQEIYTRTEKSEKQPEQVESFAGRVSENLSSFSQPEPLEIVGPVEEELPLVEKTEVVETAPLSSKPKAEKKPQSRGRAAKAKDNVQKPDDVKNENLWNDFSNQLKEKGKKLSYSYIGLLRKEAKKAGWTLEEIIEEIVLRGSTYVKSEWLEPKDPNAVWVKAEDYQPELPPVEFAPSAQEKFDQIMARSSYAYNVSDLSMFDKAMKKKQLEQKKPEEK